MIVPVLREVLRQNKELHIVMVSRGNFADLFHGIERLSFHGVDLKQHKGAFGIARLASSLLKKYQPSNVLDLHHVLRSQIISLVARAKGFPVVSIDKGKREKKKLVQIDNLDKKQLKRTTERYADCFRKAGFPVVLSDVLQSRFVDGVASGAKKEGVGFAPFAQHKGKMLPLDKSFEVVRHISKTKPVYLFGGGKKEVSILKEWEQKLSNVYSLAGTLSLTQELEKIANLEVMISMDSANMHLASLVGTRVVSVWGATHLYAGFLGYGQSPKDAVSVNDLSCRPCSIFGKKTCYRGDWACLEQIKVQDILSKL